MSRVMSRIVGPVIRRVVARLGSLSGSIDSKCFGQYRLMKCWTALVAIRTMLQYALIKAVVLGLEGRFC